MSLRTALLDANILYPAPMRDLFLQLAVSDLFKAKWTEEIHREWIEALLRNEPHRKRAALERTRNLMNQATRDCIVSGYEPLISGLDLPDPNDLHVLAAAIVGQCDVIVTKNTKHFPEERLAPHGLEAQRPDQFLSDLLALDFTAFCASIRKVRERLKNPPYAADEYLTILTRQGLVATAAELEAFADLM